VRNEDYHAQETEANAGKNTLTVFPLAQYSLVGTWTTQGGIRKALVVTPGEEGVIVTTGDRIGDREGTILAINDNSVTVRQAITTSAGTSYFEDFQLILNNE
jgi:Tfp pilus assembly protein PilP